MRKHLAEGKLPTRLALSWEGRIGFTLTESMQLKKLAFLEGVFDDRPNDDESGFDTDVALATGELSKLIPAVIDALGGEIEPGAALRALNPRSHRPSPSRKPSPPWATATRRSDPHRRLNHAASHRHQPRRQRRRALSAGS